MRRGAIIYEKYKYFYNYQRFVAPATRNYFLHTMSRFCRRRTTQLGKTDGAIVECRQKPV